MKHEYRMIVTHRGVRDGGRYIAYSKAAEQLRKQCWDTRDSKLGCMRELVAEETMSLRQFYRIANKIDAGCLQATELEKVAKRDARPEIRRWAVERLKMLVDEIGRLRMEKEKPEPAFAGMPLMAERTEVL